MEKASNTYLLILCGGTGPRLWPLSRADYPKQFLHLISNQSLISNTVSRFKKIVPSQNIFIISNQKYHNLLLKEFKGTLAKNNMILEPERKNTAMAISYGCSVISKINQQAVIIATPADHHIINQKNFIKDIQKAVAVASKSDQIVTIGIKATDPNPAYGYILTSSKNDSYFPVVKFIEKPKTLIAKRLIKQKAFWNSGIYIFNVNTMATQLSIHQKKMFSDYQKLLASSGDKFLKNIYHRSENFSFDKAISERSKNLVMISANFGWSDIGQWQSIFTQLSKDEEGISTINKCTFSNYDSKNCLLSTYPQKLVGLVGVNNLAIIDTPDALLVCNLNDSYSVRNLVKQIVSNPKYKNFFLKSS